MTINIKVCVYNLCLTLSLHHKFLSSYWPFPKKIDIEFFLWTLRNVRNIKVPFSVPVHSALYFHLLLMLLSQSDVYSILISKHFLGGFSLLRNYKLKSVADITHVRFFIYSGCCRYLVLTISELDSDNSPLNTKLLFIDVQI